MGDEGDFWRDVRQHRKEQRAKLGIPCPECVRLLPKADPKILLPGQRCRMHKYTDPRDLI